MTSSIKTTVRVLLFVLLSGSTLWAQQGRRLQNDIRAAVWTAATIADVVSRGDEELAILATYVAHVYETSPGTSSERTLSVIKSAQASFEKELQELPTTDTAERMRRMSRAISSVPDAPSAKSFALKRLEGWPTELRSAPHFEAIGSTRLAENAASVRTNATVQWRRVYDLAQRHSVAAKVIDALLAARVPYKVTSDLPTLIESAEQLRRLPVGAGILDGLANGSANPSTSELEGAWRQVASGLQNTFTADVNALKQIDVLQQSFGRFAGANDAREAAATLVKDIRTRDDAVIRDARTSLTLISGLLSAFGQPDLGRRLNVVGQSTIHLVESVSHYTEKAASFGSGSSAFGTALLAGNLLGLGMNVLSVFDSGPTVEQLILEEVKALRNDVAQLSREMHSRFDRIDLSLTLIYDAINRNFQTLSGQLNQIQADVEGLQYGLVQLSAQLARFESNTFRYVTALSQRSLNSDFVSCTQFDVLRRQPDNELSFPDFLKCTDSFLTHATINSRDDLAAGTRYRSLDDATVLEELARVPLEANLNFVAAYTAARFESMGVRPFATGRLPNPAEWRVGAESYAEIALKAPKHFERLSGAGVTLLIKSGEQLKTAIEAMMQVPPAGDGAHAPTGVALVSALAEHYIAKRRAFVAVVRREQAAFMANHGTASNYVWGSSEQSATFQPPVPALIPCYGPDPDVAPLSFPTAIWGMFPSTVRIANDLQLGGISVCFEKPAWRDTRHIDKGNGYYQNYGVHETPIIIKFNDSEVHRVVVRGSERPTTWKSAIGTGWGVPPPSRWLNAHWETGPESEGLKARVNSGTVSTTAVYAEAQNAVRVKLATTRAELYSRLLNVIAVGNAHAQALEFDGQRELISTVIALGASRALQEDDEIRALLYGQEGLVVSADYLEMLRREGDTAVKSEAGVQPLNWDEDGPGTLASIADARVRRLATAVLHRVQVDRSSGLSQLEDLESTLQRLYALQRIVGTQAASMR